MYRDATAGSLEAARSVVQGAGAANGGLALDLWHVVDLGVSTAAIRELPAGTVVAAEVSDGERSPGPGARRSMRDRRLPGDGDFDIAGFVAAVRAAGFQGPWGVELLSAAIGDVGPAELARRAYRSTIEHVARATRTRTTRRPDESSCHTPSRLDGARGRTRARRSRAGTGTRPPGSGRDLRVGLPLPDRRDRDPARVRSPVPARPGSRGGRKGRGVWTRLSTPTGDRPAGRTVPDVVVRRVLRVHPRPAKRLPELPDHRRARRGRRSPTT